MPDNNTKEIKYPFYGYAPGNYLNRCSVCKKDIYNADKLCFVCLDCAILFAKKDIAEKDKQIAELNDASHQFQQLISWMEERIETYKNEGSGIAFAYTEACLTKAKELASINN